MYYFYFHASGVVKRYTQEIGSDKTTASLRFIIPIKARSIFQVPISQHSKNIASRFLSHTEGRPWENGYAERLIRTLKEEEVHLNDYESITEARDRIGHFITQVYHQKRPHSALGYLTPLEFQRKNLS